GLPELLLDPRPAVDTLLQHFPELKEDFESLQKVCNPEEGAEPLPEDAELQPADLRRAVCYSKLLLNVFGPNTMSPTVTAQQYNEWCQEVARFEACFGYQPGELRGQGGPGGKGAPGKEGSGREGPGVSGGRRLVSEEELQAGVKAMEGELIQRMALREVLKDDRMAAQLPPSMALIEQLLLDKAN